MLLLSDERGSFEFFLDQDEQTIERWLTALSRLRQKQADAAEQE